MSKGLKKTIAFLFFLLAGITIGSLVAYVCRDVPYLSWLSFSQTVGLSTSEPALLDLIVFQIAFGFTLTVNVAQIIFIIIAILIFSRTCKNI